MLPTARRTHSRRPYGTCSLNAISSAGLQTDQIFAFQRKDQQIGEIIDYLENNCLPSDNTHAKRVLVSEDISPNILAFWYRKISHLVFLEVSIISSFQ